jgi:hypothetical protein
LFCLGFLSFHSLISLPPRFFEVIGPRATRLPAQPFWFFHDLPSPIDGQAWPEEEVPWRLPFSRRPVAADGVNAQSIQCAQS